MLISFSDFFNWSLRYSLFKSHAINLSVFVYFYFKPSRKSIYNAGSHSVKSSRNFINRFIKFSSCMQNCINSFQSWFSSFWVNIYRNSSSVIMYSYTSVFIHNCSNMRTESSQSFIHSIIYNFLNHMMQTSLVSSSDVHSRSLSNRL